MSAAIPGLLETYRRMPVTFESGSGSTLVDTDGKSYIDMLGGIAVASVGHGHPVVTRVVTEQAARLTVVSNFFSSPPMEELSGRLHALTGMDAFFCNSGAEAIECALKLARRWGGIHKPGAHPRVVAANGAFHGRTFGALSATGQPAKQGPFEPLVPGFTHVPFGDAGALEAAMDDDVVAILLEPIQGEAGVVVPPDDYLSTARSLCDRHGALLILDEVQTGLGRTGEWFAHQHAGVTPDVMCLAKALGAGLPIGACLARPEVGAAFSLGDHGSTFGGGPVVCAAANAVLEVIETEGLVERSRKLGQKLMESTRAVFPDAREVRGKGLMVGVEFHSDVAAGIVEAALARGLIVNAAVPNVLRMVPPLVITDEEIFKAMDILGEVWRSLGAAES